MKKALHNQSINYLNFHFGLHAFANAISDIFMGVYLYEVGLPLYSIYLVMSCIFFIRLLIRPFALKLALYRGLRKSVFLGTVSYSSLYLFLGKVSGLDYWLVLFIIAAAVIDVLYWLPYHAYFSMLGDFEHRGKQIGIREGVVHLARFLAPISSGVLINFYGYWAAFITATVCMLIAAVPLMFTPEVEIEESFSLKDAWKKVNKAGAFLYAGHSIYYYAHIFTWPILLFILLKDYIYFGGLLSLAVLFQILGSLWIGHAFDVGNGKKIYPVGLALAGLVILGRTFLELNIPIIIFLDILLIISCLLYQGIMYSAHYNTSKTSDHPLWFQYFAENGWDLGAFVACLPAAALLYFGVDLKYVMLIGFLGLSVIAQFLQWYFKKNS